ncbi:MAG TPA: TonB-dependent receptor [Candidatus Eisenbacteria bacterium]|nr:TonB-dependent receptor [Candidatus Eisenbacteria bacterium]
MLSLTALLVAAALSDTAVVPLPEVVVTGTRTAESQLRAPAAITVVDRREFADTRGVSLKDALARVPGVFVQSRSGAQDIRITIRGFGARGNGERSNTGNIRGIRVMADGIPVTEPDGRSSLDLIDLGSASAVEVQRSNASALFGNATGGVVNVRSDLRFDQPFAELRERAGSFGYHREQGTVGFTAGGSRGTISVLNSTLDGWRVHSQSTSTQLQARFTTPLDQQTRLGVLLDAAANLNRFPGALTQPELDANPRQANPTYIQRDERRRNRVGRVALTLDRALELNQDLSTTLFVEPKMLQRSERGAWRDFARYHLGGSATYQLRTRLSETVQGRTAVGADEAFQDGAIQFYGLASGSRGTGPTQDKREGANSAGAFVEQELKWGGWSARAAVRYDNLWYVSENHLNSKVNAEKTFTKWTPKISLSYAFDSHTVYAALGGGVEAPAFNEIDPPPGIDTLTSLNPFLEPMRSRTYETGLKGQLASLGALGELRYDAALYWIDVFNDIVPYNGGTYFFTAGQSRRRGAELGLDWLPARGLLIEGAVTASENRYITYRNLTDNFDGHDIAGLPKMTFSGEASYQAPAGVSLDVRAESVGKYFADDASTAVAPAYTIFGAGIGYERPLGGHLMRVFVAGDNLTDEKHVASVFINGTGNRYFEPGMPRNWSAGLTLRLQ